MFLFVLTDQMATERGRGLALRDDLMIKGRRLGPTRFKLHLPPYWIQLSLCGSQQLNPPFGFESSSAEFPWAPLVGVHFMRR